MRNDKQRRKLLYEMAIEAIMVIHHNKVESVAIANQMALKLVDSWIESYNVTFYFSDTFPNKHNKSLVIREKDTRNISGKEESKPSRRVARLVNDEVSRDKHGGICSISVYSTGRDISEVL